MANITKPITLGKRQLLCLRAAATEERSDRYFDVIAFEKGWMAAMKCFAPDQLPYSRMLPELTAARIRALAPTLQNIQFRGAPWCYTTSHGVRYMMELPELGDTYVEGRQGYKIMERLAELGLVEIRDEEWRRDVIITDAGREALREAT